MRLAVASHCLASGAAAWQRRLLTGLRFRLERLGAAVEKLFDDTDDWSSTPSGSG